MTFDENEDIEFLLQKKVVRMRGKKIRVRRAIPRHHSQFEHIRKHAAPVKGKAHDSSFAYSNIEKFFRSKFVCVNNLVILQILA